jgi:hypothetical protein
MKNTAINRLEISSLAEEPFLVTKATLCREGLAFFSHRIYS